MYTSSFGFGNFVLGSVAITFTNSNELVRSIWDRGRQSTLDFVPFVANYTYKQVLEALLR